MLISQMPMKSKQVNINIVPDTGVSGTVPPGSVPDEKAPNRMIPEQLEKT